MAKVELKQPIVQEISEQIKDAQSVVVVDYRGLTVAEDTQLRKQLREAGVAYKVYKNTLVNFAIKGTDFESLSDVLEGPNAFAISTTDATAPARVIAKFAKTAPALEIKAGVVEGTFYDADGMKAIATIPSREELLSKFLGSIQSPITNFARVINQIAEKGGAADVEVKAEEAAPAEDTTAEAEAPAQTTEDNGTVSTDGSTSMEKVIGALGESFMAQNDGVTFTYNPTGSGSGITAVEEGRCDIGLSSRNLKDEEVAKGLTQTVLAYDGIAIIVNPENPVADLDIDTIARIYKGEIKNWSEVGGNDAEIVLIGREAGSGTRDGFESITGTEDACAYRQELTSTGDVITTVAQNPDAIGYASLASVKDSVKALSVGGVVPTEDTVKDGSYVIQRPFVLVTKDGVALSATARKFFDYITSADAAGIISEAGAVAAN